MKVLSFNTGLEQVFSDAPAPAHDFPKKKHLTPFGDGIASHMQDLFDGKTVDQQLEIFVKPTVTYHELLTVEGFNRQYSQTCALLRNEIAHKQEQRHELSLAIELLEENKSNVDLLAMYRNLLLQA